MAFTSLTQSTSGSSSSSLTRSGTPYAQSTASEYAQSPASKYAQTTVSKYAQSPASKIKNVAAHPISNITPQKSPATPSGTPNGSPAIIMTPGRWQHPRMDEIVRRQNASCFNPGDARIVVLNLVVIVLTFIAQPYLSSYVSQDTATVEVNPNSKQHPHTTCPQHALRKLDAPHSPPRPPNQHGRHPRAPLPPS